MNLDKTLTFFEKATVAPAAAETVKKTGGADYSRTFIAATIPTGVTALRLTVATAESLSGAGDLEAPVTVAIKDATAQEIAAGVMAIPTPHDLGKFTKVTPVIQGEPEVEGQGVTCGITDAVPNGILMK